MSYIPVPEVREMVAVARRFVAGEVHFSAMVGPAESCHWYAKVHNSHPAIRQLAADWQHGADLVWNEWGQHQAPISVEEYRRRVAGDLGEPLHDQ
jgi:hypothetical protein